MFDFSTVVDRHGTWCTQWDYVADRFGAADLLPFTISDMDFATAPCITEALHQRIHHGVFGYSRWKNEEFLAAVAHWFRQRFNSHIDTESLVYGAFRYLYGVRTDSPLVNSRRRRGGPYPRLRCVL